MKTRKRLKQKTRSTDLSDIVFIEKIQHLLTIVKCNNSIKTMA